MSANPTDLVAANMKRNLPKAIVLCAVLAAGFAGCSRQTDANRELEKAAKAMEQAVPDPQPAVAVQPAPQALSAQNAAPSAAEIPQSPVQQVNQALASYKNGDYEDAVTRLQKLRAKAAMSPAQNMALQDAMAAVMTDIYDRASKGDARAKQAVKQYEEMQTAPRTR